MMSGETEEKMYFRTRIPKNLHKKFKRLCLEMDVTMEAVANELIEDWVCKKEEQLFQKQQSTKPSNGEG